jgi:glycosyltransferase involved in cell wall biosynthesis
MRILILGDMPPSPQGITVGHQQVYHRIRQLTREHEFTVAYVNWANEPEPQTSAQNPFRLVSLPAPPRPIKLPPFVGSVMARRWQAWRHALLDRRSLILYGRGQPELRAALTQLVHEQKPEIVHVAGLLMLYETPADTHNILADVMDMWSRSHWQRADTQKKITHRIQYWLEGKKIEALEREQLRRARMVLTVSPLEKQVAERLAPRTSVTVVPTTTDLNYFHASGTAADSATLVFTGSMDYAPNVEAVQYFCNDILPRIQRKVPNVQFFIVGRSPTREVSALASESVHVTGAVDDVRPYLSRATVVVVPLKHGAGTRNKIIEAWAMQKAIVSTTLGAEGLLGEHMQHFWLADTPESFAQAVLTLTQDSELRGRLGEEGRRRAEENYSLTAAARQLNEIYCSIGQEPA